MAKVLLILILGISSTSCANIDSPYVRHWFDAQRTPSPDGIPLARPTFNTDWQGILKRFDQGLLDTEPQSAGWLTSRA